jgi:NAD(P)-dependent dehydrogenase (short-subunit alcohol dehydrogenase family)
MEPNLNRGTPDMSTQDAPSEQDLAACLKVLRDLARQPALCTGDRQYAAICAEAGRLVRAVRKQQNHERQERDRDLLDAAGIRASLPPTPEPAALPEAPTAVLTEPRRCYVCKQPYARLHPFYDSLCPACGDFNYAKRSQTANLSGMVALVTGGRIKIGFQTVLKLLRAGAEVVATTRFPHDAARRYAREPDFNLWRDRLRIQALDLRHLPAVDQFAAALADRLDRLDIVINNAAQTVRRPPAYYRHLLDGEHTDRAALPVEARNLLLNLTPPAAEGALATHVPPPALFTQLLLLPGDGTLDATHFPSGWYDADGQQVDLRPHNSWSAELAEVAPIELLEVHAINCLAPFLLLRRLEPLLFRSSNRSKFVVNVSAMEGQLNAAYKTGRHPHTNMAKAALNMITRTCADSYSRHGVFMNSVDTGWITNEAPRPTAERMTAEGFREPLDVIDGAARVLDPIFVGLNAGCNDHGLFLKDYRSIPW